MKNDMSRIHDLFSYATVHNICTINQKLDYPSNRNKPFVSEDVFYEQLDKKMYKEYNNAAYSVRKRFYLKKYPTKNFPFYKNSRGLSG